MAHISESELLWMTEKIEKDKPFSRFEEQLMKHVKMCPICRDRIGEALNRYEMKKETRGRAP